jgi:hypothetical protein
MGPTFLITAFVIVATPGTGALLTISAGLARGARAALVAAAGCTLGIVPHLAAAVTGTAALLRASGVAFEAIKLIGIAYLLYMAWATWTDHTPLVAENEPDPMSTSRAVLSAILANLLNPKLTIFFFAFLPGEALGLASAYDGDVRRRPRRARRRRCRTALGRSACSSGQLSRGRRVGWVIGRAISAASDRRTARR